MLSCRDLCCISAHLAQITGDFENVFGGINMVFAGDFAQLPPVIGKEHASLYSHTIGQKVPLYKKLRTALENMRYKACTNDNIKFLESLISSTITALNVHKDAINIIGAQ